MPRGTLAQGAFQLRRLQPRPARSPEAPQPETGTPPPPRAPEPSRTLGRPGPQGANRRGTQQGCDRTTAPSPGTLTCGLRAAPPPSPDGSRRSWRAAPGSRARRGPQVRRRQEREPGLPAPERWRAVRARAVE